MHADHALRAGGRGGEGGDRDRGGVRCEHGLGRQRLVGAPEDVFLDGRILDDGLDHQVGRDELVDGLDPRQDLVGVGPALLGELAEAAAHRLEAVLDRSGGRVTE